MECVGHLKMNDTSNIGMVTCASKYGSINFPYQCLHILSDKSWINVLKWFNITKRESESKYNSHFYNI